MITSHFALITIFTFIFGSISGWILEVLFRKFFSRTNPDHKWLNPGLLVGPWLPIYGFGVCLLSFISTIINNLNLSGISFYLVLFFGSATAMTLLELIGGELLLRLFKMRLWDYRDLPINFDGVICIEFYFIWGLTSVIFYFVIAELLIKVELFYINHFIFLTFFLGIAVGLFIVDLWNSLGVTTAIKKYAKENGIVIDFETVKQEAARQNKINKGKKVVYQSRRQQLIDFLKENKLELEKILSRR